MTMHNPLNTPRSLSMLCLAFGLTAAPAMAQVLEVISDATIRQQLCVGLQCADNPSSNFPDTGGLAGSVMLNAARTRIDFVDASAGDFPANDWAISANENAEFGRDQFAIEDTTGGTVPFIVEAGAPSNSLFVAANDNVGLGTTVPQLDLHINRVSAGIRLENVGPTPGIYDIKVLQNQFSIFNSTPGAVNPIAPRFAITAGAPENAFILFGGEATFNGASNDYNFRVRGDEANSTLLFTDAGTSFVGIGTGAPAAPLHVFRSDSTGKLLIEDTGSAFNTQVEIKKNGTPRFRFDDTRFDVAPLSGNNLPAEWDLGLDNNRDFILRNVETNFNVFKVLKTGNLEIAGSLTENSDKNAKMAIVPIDAADVLAKVEALPIATWSYKDTADVRHIGPMAQDFRALFGTGASDTGISTLDTSGVALAAIKALSEDNKALATQMQTLAEDNRALLTGNEALVADNMAQRDLIAQLAARLDALERAAR